jgi:hypothetical protein
MMTVDEVKSFLRSFKEKMKIWSIFFRDDRGKNTQTLAALEITPAFREKVILDLEPEDYCEGPLTDTLNKGGDMWVFGKTNKKREVYIKITMGIAGSGVVCISFHIAEHALNYPFK